MIEACFFPQTFDPEILMVWAFLYASLSLFYPRPTRPIKPPVSFPHFSLPVQSAQRCNMCAWKCASIVSDSWTLNESVAKTSSLSGRLLA